MEAGYPGIPTAYDFVLPSYAWVQQRLDSVHGRIQNLQAFAATLFVAGPALARGTTDLDLKSPWFLVSAAALFLTILTGIVAREWGTIKLLDPAVLNQKWLHLTEVKFKRDAIYFAGEHFGHNRRLINRKSYAASAMTGLLVIEVLTLAVWVGQTAT